MCSLYRAPLLGLQTQQRGKTGGGPALSPHCSVRVEGTSPAGKPLGIAGGPLWSLFIPSSQFPLALPQFSCLPPPPCRTCWSASPHLCCGPRQHRHHSCPGVSHCTQKPLPMATLLPPPAPHSAGGALCVCPSQGSTKVTGCCRQHPPSQHHHHTPSMPMAPARDRLHGVVVGGTCMGSQRGLISSPGDLEIKIVFLFTGSCTELYCTNFVEFAWAS